MYFIRSYNVIIHIYKFLKLGTLEYVGNKSGSNRK